MSADVSPDLLTEQTAGANVPFASWTTSALLDQLLNMCSQRTKEWRPLPELFDPANGNDPSVKQCLIAREVVRRWLITELKGGALFTSPQMVRDYLLNHFAGHEHEAFVVLFLDAQHRLIAAEEMFRGTLTQTCVYPREVVKAALERNCAAVVFAHNHPSGATTPSRADELLTQALKNALDLVDVRVIDHFVVGQGAALSFAEQRLL